MTKRGVDKCERGCIHYHKVSKCNLTDESFLVCIGHRYRHFEKEMKEVKPTHKDKEQEVQR